MKIPVIGRGVYRLVPSTIRFRCWEDHLRLKKKPKTCRNTSNCFFTLLPAQYSRQTVTPHFDLRYSLESLICKRQSPARALFSRCHHRDGATQIWRFLGSVESLDFQLKMQGGISKHQPMSSGSALSRAEHSPLLLLLLRLAHSQLLGCDNISPSTLFWFLLCFQV